MFPPLSYAADDGLLAIGGDLSRAMLWEAYSHGIFPWPCEDFPMLWFAPPHRALLFFDEVHVNRRLARSLRNSGFRATFDRDFCGVMLGCATPHNDDATWISGDIITAYHQLNLDGDPRFRARSVEVWLDDELVGGLYGVQMNRYFCGESMFHTRANASKFALLFLIDELRRQGATWLDCQVMNPYLRTLGAREVPRETFMEMLVQEIDQVGTGSIAQEIQLSRQSGF